ncbi:MAG: hypothetical protein U0547_11735 [Dehalococcoidia bacterium]
MQALVVSSKATTKDGSHDVFVGGSSTGTKLNGVYRGGTYSGGTKTATVTAVTTNASLFGGR